jgi:nucleotide-binding universal stress UspA family protein
MCCPAAGPTIGANKEETMKKILIATDGSPSALQAVEVGLELAAEHESELTFVHVAPAADVLPVAGFAMAGPVSVPHELDEHDRSSLDEALHLAEEQGLDAWTKLLVGDAAKQIVAFADEIDADLIVVGSRGLGAIGGTLLGSVSRRILHEAKRPVLIVREVPAAVSVA